MQLLYGIGIYLLASSLFMIGSVWVRYIKHNQSEYRKASHSNNFEVEDQLTGENLAA